LRNAVQRSCCFRQRTFDRKISKRDAADLHCSSSSIKLFSIINAGLRILFTALQVDGTRSASFSRTVPV
jgi:hypothetical protein